MTHENLTPRDAINYSIRRMPEQTIDRVRGLSSNQTVPKDIPAKPEVVNRPWQETQMHRVLREMGVKPQTLENPLSPEEERLEGAVGIIGRELSDKEQSAVLEAHNVGIGEKGKDGGRAEIGNYTQKQISEKARILKEAGFSQEERRSLIESGIAGLPPAMFAAIDPNAYANDEVKNIAAFVKDAGTEGNVDSAFLQSQILRLDVAINSGIAVGEARALRNQVQLLTRQAFTQETEETGERNRERRGHAPEGLTIEQVNEMIDEAPDVGGSRFPPDVMEAAFRFKETRERLINRILFKSFEDTTDANRYEINLYAQDNLEQLLGFLSREDRTKYDYFVKLRTAAELFHSMNSTMVGGKLEEFIRVAANINYEHFSLMQQIRGIPDVMRLYEEKYQEILAKNKRIATEGYIKLREEVEKSFRALNEAGLIRSEYEGERTGDAPEKMQEWEVSRALNAGRTFFNITFRAAEHIANGQLEEGGRKWTGFPQEDAVRLMNWSKWLVERFGVAEPRGGIDFLHRTNRNYFEFLDSKRRKLGINRIAELGGMKVNELELGAMFGTSGVYSSWRNETMLFPRIKIGRAENSPTLKEWLDVKIPWRGQIVKKQEHGKWVVTSETEQKRYKWIGQIRGDSKDQDELMEFLSPVVENVDIGLGVLLRQGILSDEVGYKVRQRIWQRVAEENLPLMINYLSSISQKAEPIKFTEDEPLKGAPPAENRIRPAGWNDEQWNEFKRKIMVKHAWKIKKAALPMIPNEERLNLGDEVPEPLTPEEQVIVDNVISQGRNLAPDLADILFPYTPFMNDVPFELIDYAGPGETFYKRRSGSDLPSYSAANHAFTTIVGNPGGIGAEEALKAFDEIVKGIESPQGTEDAQERVFPMFSAWGEFVMARPGQRQSIVKSVTELLRQPTSIAQEYAGMDADSLTEQETLHILGEATKKGILSHGLYDEMKKKKHLGLIYLLWALIRDVSIFVPIIAGVQIGKETLK